MNRIHDNLERKDFQKFSPIVEERTYCTVSGLLAGDSCTSRATGWYSKENLPGTCTTCKGAPPAEEGGADSSGEQPQETPSETTTAPVATEPATEVNTQPEESAPAA